ncbi:hypothetical protein LCGC14_1420960, partial [marine sediment metagenome]
TVHIGGNETIHNTATAIEFYTAANTITIAGTLLADMTGVGATSLFHLRGKFQVVGLSTMAALDLSGQIDLNNNNIIAGGTAAFTTVTAALSGNASTATLLQNARTINGVSFNGGANITVTADANTLTNTTLKSTVVASSLTSVGTLSSLNMGGNIDLNTNNIIAGGAASFTTITASTALIRGATNSALVVSGGSTTALGGNIVLYGESHASRAKDIELRSGTNLVLDWDDNTSELTITGQLRVLTQGVTVGSPVAGNKGTGTINVQFDIYQNDSAYTNPDFVFEYAFVNKLTNAPRGWKLRSLRETKAYAERWHHLPGVHRDKAMGIFKRSDWVAEKMEEVHLHLFTHEDRIGNLETQVAGLLAA